jgi:hypothetical protein
MENLKKNSYFIIVLTIFQIMNIGNINAEKIISYKSTFYDDTSHYINQNEEYFQKETIPFLFKTGNFVFDSFIQNDISEKPFKTIYDSLSKICIPFEFINGIPSFDYFCYDAFEFYFLIDTCQVLFMELLIEKDVITHKDMKIKDNFNNNDFRFWLKKLLNKLKMVKKYKIYILKSNICETIEKEYGNISNQKLLKENPFYYEYIKAKEKYLIKINKKVNKK